MHDDARLHQRRFITRSGGFFVHLGLGQQGHRSPGTALTRGGALLIAAALIIVAVGLITHR